jgi:hypothetical protein
METEVVIDSGDVLRGVRREEPGHEETGTPSPTGETACSLLGTIAGRIQRTSNLNPNHPD